MAIFLKLLLLPISLLFYYVKDQIMGGTSTKEVPVPAPSTQINQNSSGFHIMEFHGATIGSGAIVLLIILAVCIGICYGYSRLRRRCKKSMMRRYFGTQPQMALPYGQQMQMMPLNPPQPQTVVSMPAALPALPAPPQMLALPAPASHCAGACSPSEVVPYKPGYKYCLPHGT